MADVQTYSAKMVAGIVADRMKGIRRYSDKDVRDVARDGERDGKPLLPRFATRPADGSNRQHSYTAYEVRLILEHVAARHHARTQQTVKVPAPFATAGAPRSKRSKPRKSTAQASKSAPVTRSTTPSTAPVTVAPVASEETPA